METKLFEIRDNMTLIAVMATWLKPSNEEERWLLSRSGFGKEPEHQSNYLLLSKLEGSWSHYDPYKWNDHTMHEAHIYIFNNWHDLRTR